MQVAYGKKVAGTGLFVLLVAAGLLTTVAFAQALSNNSSAGNGNGKALGHTYGIGNSGATPPGHGGTPPGQLMH